MFYFVLRPPGGERTNGCTRSLLPLRRLDRVADQVNHDLLRKYLVGPDRTRSGSGGASTRISAPARLARGITISRDSSATPCTDR
jgi:hypothetical protein